MIIIGVLCLSMLSVPILKIKAAERPVISSVSPITATRLQTITITGSGFGNTWPQTWPLGDGSVQCVDGSVPSIYLIDSGKTNKTGDTSLGGNNWIAAGPGSCIGVYLENWTDTEVVLGGFGEALGVDPSQPRYIEDGDPINVTIVTSSGQDNRTVIVGQLPLTFDVTINAHCNTEGVGVNVPITQDGSATGLSTPHTFTGLTGTHTFTVPDKDANNHPFKAWIPGSATTTTTVSGEGTYEAYYEAPLLPYTPLNVTARPGNLAVKLTWDPPANSSDVQGYNIYRGTSPDFWSKFLPPIGTRDANTRNYDDSLSDDTIYYYQVAARFPEGLSMPSSPAVACARLESLKGIYNEFTGLNTLSITDKLSTFTIQQNFIICTGGQPEQYYWCQNYVEKYAWGSFARGIMKIWGPDPVPTQDPRIPTGSHMKSSFPPTPNPPNTVKLVSYIDGNRLVMQNPFQGVQEFTDLNLTSDAYIYTTTNNYSPTDFLTDPVEGPPNFPPNFVVVGRGSTDPDKPEETAYFTSGSGSVSSKFRIGDGGIWKSGKTPGPLALISQTNPLSIGKAIKNEQSFNLAWSLDGSFSYQEACEDEGVFIVPDFASPTTPKPLMDSSTTRARAIIVYAECPVYIEVYDDKGRSVGFNSTSGTVESSIPSVLWESNQSIVIFDPNGTYRVEVTGTDNGTYELEASWQDISGITVPVLNYNGTITRNETQVYIIGDRANLALTCVSASKTVIGQGLCAQVKATVADLGGADTTFNLALYANDTLIGTQSMLNISGWNSADACFTWNTTGLAYGRYTLSAIVQPANNTLTGNWIFISIIGDLAGSSPFVPDGKVDIRDIAMVAKVFGFNYPDPRYNPNCDSTGATTGVPDGKIDIRDIALIARHFGETYS